jgi:NTP pyrophosphatase (non-canonical NTP hydrolase)
MTKKLITKQMSKVRKERNTQDKKWGSNRVLTIEALLAILGEELGEVAEAVAEEDAQNLHEELIQAGAIAILMLENNELLNSGNPATSGHHITDARGEQLVRLFMSMGLVCRGILEADKFQEYTGWNILRHLSESMMAVTRND